MFIIRSLSRYDSNNYNLARAHAGARMHSCARPQHGQHPHPMMFCKYEIKFCASAATFKALGFCEKKTQPFSTVCASLLDTFNGEENRNVNDITKYVTWKEIVVSLLSWLF